MLPPSWRSGSARTVACLVLAIRADSVAASYDTANATGLAASQILSDPFPYYFPEQNATSAAKLFAMPLCNGVKLEEATIDELQSHMSRGQLTSVQIVTCYVQRAYQTGEYIKSVLSHSWTIPMPRLDRLLVIKYADTSGKLRFEAESRRPDNRGTTGPRACRWPGSWPTPWSPLPCQRQYRVQGQDGNYRWELGTSGLYCTA